CIVAFVRPCRGESVLDPLISEKLPQRALASLQRRLLTLTHGFDRLCSVLRFPFQPGDNEGLRDCVYVTPFSRCFLAQARFYIRRESNRHNLSIGPAHDPVKRGQTAVVLPKRAEGANAAPPASTHLDHHRRVE